MDIVISPKTIVLIFFGIFVHIICFVSVSDIYFRSIVVHGITTYSSPLEPPANRIVFIVCDGLRADNFFEANGSKEGNTPYLRSVIENRGMWGVSHTRAPTESRPTHVAMFAGFYEDPAAIFKQFKTNPVEFDSVFNESQNTWIWSSVKFMTLFKAGTASDHVTILFYGNTSSEQDIQLHRLGFFEMEKFLLSETGINTLELNEDKIIFFLHLQGTDNAGHIYKPFSEKFSENLQIIDKNIKMLEEKIENFYIYDHKTTYIFTADHGMTSYGVHGTGHINETQVPLVAWGAGIHGPRSVMESKLRSPASWELSHRARFDINSIDLAPLIASLIGTPIPANSMGILPHVYLNVSDHQLSEMMLANALQMLSQYRRKKQIVEKEILSFMNREFPLLSQKEEFKLTNLTYSYIKSRRYKESIKLSENLIYLSLLGMDYYQNYYKHLLLITITISFLGWIIYLLQLFITDENISVYINKESEQFTNKTTCSIRSRNSYKLKFMNTVFGAIVIFTTSLIYGERLPLKFYLYFMLPIFLWWAVACKKSSLLLAFCHLKYSMGLWSLLLQSVFCILTTEIIVGSFSSRCYLSLGMLILAAWPMTSLHHVAIPSPLIHGWLSSSLCLAIFPLLPEVCYVTSRDLVVFSGLLFILVMAYIAWQFELYQYATDTKDCQYFHHTVEFQFMLLLLSVWNILFVDVTIYQENNFLRNQILSWILLILALFLPLMGSQNILLRLFSIQISMCTPILLMSSSYEGLFYLILVLHMFCWLLLEIHIVGLKKKCKLSELSYLSFKKETSYHSVTSEDLRRTAFYLIMCVFGMHRTEDFNLINPVWVQCFVTMDYRMISGLLILFKIVLFMVVPTNTFYTLNLILQAPTKRLYLLLLIFSQATSVQLLYSVMNQGPWSAIGASVANYAVMQFCAFALAFLHGVAMLITRIYIWDLLYYFTYNSCGRFPFI